jgi:peptide/nickel transport system ATP-binding protein
MSAVPKPRASPTQTGDGVIVMAKDVAKYFDVSPPWLNRLLERKPRAILHAVDGVSFEIQRGFRLAYGVRQVHCCTPAGGAVSAFAR